MPNTTRPGDWTPERLDRLTRGMFPVVFGRPAPECALVPVEEDSDAAVEERP
jgi:hypothetical protein